MRQQPGLTSGFNAAAGNVPETDFARYLASSFDEDTACRVLDTFAKLGLPAPETQGEFVAGTDGGLVFLNRYGVVLRIEKKDTSDTSAQFWSDRVNDNPLILRPLATLSAGQAHIEICPGCHTTNDQSESRYLQAVLREQGINYWDEGAHNIGRVPVKTSSFPQGLSVVVDRGAVNELTTKADVARRALTRQSAETRAAEQALEGLYGGLCRRFVDCWEGRREMQDFWGLCAKYTAAGKLVAGWNEATPGDAQKKQQAITAAARYDSRLPGLTAAQKPASPIL